MKRAIPLFLISFASFGQIVRHNEDVRPNKIIPFAGMYIIVTKDHPFPKCGDFAKINWTAMKKRHKELAAIAKEAHEVTIVYLGGIKCYLTFDQLKEIACK